ncbi:iron hydrogenase [Flammula alnicola]|nr:iron hydrogenase [Flammula alnicola]
MSCYDKKLEASRKDFYDEVYATRDVDCVITTGELELMMRDKGWDLGSQTQQIQLPELIQHSGTSSGSYTLTEDKEGGRVVFKGAKCYGFRNLQNIVRKVGKERGVRTGGGAAGRLAARVGARRTTRRGGGAGEEERKYEYVEVMACPGGCVNGGGQLKAVAAAVTRDEEKYEREWGESGVSVDGMPSGKWGDKEWTRQVEEAYWRERPGVPVHDLDTPPYTPRTGHVNWTAEWRNWQGERRKLMRTEYRAVESEIVGLAVKW